MSNRKPLTREELEKLAEEHTSWANAARAIGLPPTTVRARASTLDVQIKATPNLNSKNVISSDPAEWNDIRKLIESRGLRSEDYLVTRVRVNEWADQRQLRVDLEPVSSILLPARTEGWKAPAPKAVKASAEKLVVFLSDHHVPFHSRPLGEKVLSWLASEQPDEIIVLGDLCDFDQISRFERTPEHSATMQETLDEAYLILREYRTVCPDAKITMVAGNHEERLRSAIIKHLGALFGIRKAFDSGPSVLSLEHLLRLDELRINFVRSEAGSYQHAAVKISDELQAIHGWVARKGSGSSARATLDHMRVSTVQGHTHRASTVYQTQWNIDNEPRTLVAAETGTLAEIKDGLAHAARPDWQQGFATASVFPDGLFSLDLAVYVNEALIWRGRRW